MENIEDGELCVHRRDTQSNKCLQISLNRTTRFKMYAQHTLFIHSIRLNPMNCCSVGQKVKLGNSIWFLHTQEVKNRTENQFTSRRQEQKM